jgi:glycosyltransferase involved in cell wall biosynthesis
LDVDVFIPTYNSEKYLRECINSILSSIPVKRIVIIDNYSTDKTQSIAKEFGCEVILDSSGLGKAREISFLEASTDIFVTVESDIVYSETGWFEKAVSLFKENVGAVVAYVPRPTSEERGLYSYILSKYTPLREKKHGFSAGSTLWLRKAVKDISVPQSLHAYEDIYIAREMKKRGWIYRWIEVKGIHHSTIEDRRKAEWYGANARIFYSLTSDISLLRRHITLPIKAAVASLLSGNPRILSWSFGFTISFMKGWSAPSRYSRLRR